MSAPEWLTVTRWRIEKADAESRANIDTATAAIRAHLGNQLAAMSDRDLEAFIAYNIVLDTSLAARLLVAGLVQARDQTTAEHFAALADD